MAQSAMIQQQVEISLTDWAQAHQIQLIGTQQDDSDIYYDGFDPAKVIEASQVPGFSNAIEALMLLPDYVLVVMEPQYNQHTKRTEIKAIYFSTKEGRSYAQPMPYGYGDYAGIWVGGYPGFVLDQPITGYIALHECGHIVDFLGVRTTWTSASYYWEPIPALSGHADEAIQIFDAQGVLWIPWANVNWAEDFAVHFEAYVWEGEPFRAAAFSNPDLAERYSFLKDYVFQGVEYGIIIPPDLAIVGCNVWVSPSHEPIAGAYIYYDGELKGTTDQMGYFEVSLPAKTYEVHCEKEGYGTLSLSVSVVAGQHYHIGFGLYPSAPPPPEAAVLSGDISDAVTGRPIAGARVYYDSTLLATTDSQGHYSGNVTPGRYVFWAAASGYMDSPQIPSSLESGGNYTGDFILLPQVTPPPPPPRVPSWVLPVGIVGGLAILYAATRRRHG